MSDKVTITIKHRFTNNDLFIADLSDDYSNEAASIQLGAAMRLAIKSGASLRRADLSGADLIGADLSGANLSGADLSGADLIGAGLSDADLVGADLIGADLSDADLRRADLIGADLSDADLRRADLSGANLIGADLSGADLRRADLSGANLRGANLRIYCGIYTVIVTPTLVQISCQRHRPEQWLALTEAEAYAMGGARAVEALRQDGPVIKLMIEQMRPDLAGKESNDET